VYTDNASSIQNAPLVVVISRVKRLRYGAT
jgi:hypothetical protein